MEKHVNIRTTAEDLDLWREAAWLRKVSLSLWIRSVLNATAKQTLSQREEILKQK